MFACSYDLLGPSPAPPGHETRFARKKQQDSTRRRVDGPILVAARRVLARWPYAFNAALCLSAAVRPFNGGVETAAACAACPAALGQRWASWTVRVLRGPVALSPWIDSKYSNQALCGGLFFCASVWGCVCLTKCSPGWRALRGYKIGNTVASARVRQEM